MSVTSAVRTYTFKVVIEEDAFADGTPAYHAFCPALPGCQTWGYTREEALRNLHEAVELYLESLRAHNEPIPTELVFEGPLVSVVLPK
ncbi:MAG: type II toxin-antitoxin system HicB family antitoxin [Candidatus Bipolaricaulota bacterium]|nr:type II toxin-antitoxin system HicB family antitoxin [Candidatus Bipolaricaulota bacterium]